jgi:hypothetical protein
MSPSLSLRGKVERGNSTAMGEATKEEPRHFQKQVPAGRGERKKCPASVPALHFSWLNPRESLRPTA